MEALKRMSPDELSTVRDFTILHPHGKCVWPGLTDLRGVLTATSSTIRPDSAPIPTQATVQLDSVVRFFAGSVEVYPAGTEVPAVNKGFNKETLITLFGCWPGGKRTEKAGRLQRYRARLQSVAHTTFIGYEKASGTWQFSVPNWETQRC